MHGVRALSTLILTVACPASGQQWTVVVLHPPGGASSEVTCLTGTRQSGPYDLQTGYFAGFWSGSAGSWTALSPAGGYVVGMDQTSQVGYYFGAALWRGTPQSYVSLNPPGANTTSQASAVHGNMQAGMVALPFNVDHAAMWRGTRESFIDLHPAGAIRSYCLATDGTLQGGFADFSNGSHPGVWNGSSQSWKDLTPMGLSGKVNGMAPGVQVGKVNFVGSERAALWRGTPESFEDFGPPGVTYSAFFATTGSIHVGQLIQNGLSRAAINFGTPGSWLGLHQFLPAQYTGYSAAKAVYQDGSTIYVGGYADFGHREAILWIGTLPCYANCDGSTRTPLLTANDFQCFLNAFASASPTANCDASSGNPALTANDFQCYINRFAAGCT